MEQPCIGSSAARCHAGWPRAPLLSCSLACTRYALLLSDTLQLAIAPPPKLISPRLRPHSPFSLSISLPPLLLPPEAHPPPAHRGQQMRRHLVAVPSAPMGGAGRPIGSHHVAASARLPVPPGLCHRVLELAAGGRAQAGRVAHQAERGEARGGGRATRLECAARCTVFGSLLTRAPVSRPRSAREWSVVLITARCSQRECNERRRSNR